MSQALLSLLLSVLLVRSHELCRDDIISTFYSILTNDNTKNFSHFIQNYLEQTNIQTILNDKHKRLLLENYGRNETVRFFLFQLSRKKNEIFLLIFRIYQHLHKILMILFMIIDIIQRRIQIEKYLRAIFFYCFLFFFNFQTNLRENKSKKKNKILSYCMNCRIVFLS